MLKIIQSGSGFTGKFALRGVIERSDMELVGMLAHSPEKKGRDAGEIVGLPPVGVVATDNIDELLKLGADCVLFLAKDPNLDDPAIPGRMPAQHIDLICRFLRAGLNVVGTAPSCMVYPDGVDASVIEKLEAAAKEGNSSYVGIGIDPGFMNDYLPLALTGFTSGVTKIIAQEMLNYGSYSVPEMLRSAGFGLPPKIDPEAGRPAGTVNTWGASVKAIADKLGLKLDEIRLVREQAVAEWDFEIPAFKVEKGTVAAHSFEVQGMVGGEPRIIVQHITRLHDDVAPHWARLKSGSGGFRVVIEGSPSMTCEVAMATNDAGPIAGGSATADACHATAARAVNAVPLLCAAPSGVHSQFTLPLIVGRGLFKI
jgi:4-hydroxy-tetrahydrodipicolinate reductase